MRKITQAILFYLFFLTFIPIGFSQNLDGATVEFVELGETKTVDDFDDSLDAATPQASYNVEFKIGSTENLYFDVDGNRIIIGARNSTSITVNEVTFNFTAGTFESIVGASFNSGASTGTNTEGISASYTANSVTLIGLSNKNFSENYALGEIGTVVFDIKTTPKVNNVNVPANGTYTTGQNLDFTANFNENIIVNTTSGTPQIAVTIGSVVRQATYISGSGTSALLFRYTVTTGDLDTDGIAVGALSANGSTLQDASGNNANLTLNSVGSTLNVLVDSTLSIDAFKNEAQFSMYPNPSHNNVNIKTSLGGEFQIINQLGQNVKTFRLQSAIENNIYVGNLSNGLYFVKGSNGVSKKLVIKN